MASAYKCQTGGNGDIMMTVRDSWGGRIDPDSVKQRLHTLDQTLHELENRRRHKTRRAQSPMSQEANPLLDVDNPVSPSEGPVSPTPRSVSIVCCFDSCDLSIGVAAIRTRLSFTQN